MMKQTFLFTVLSLGIFLSSCEKDEFNTEDGALPVARHIGTISGGYYRTSMKISGVEDLRENDCRKESGYEFREDGTLTYYYYRVYGRGEPECVLWDSVVANYIVVKGVVLIGDISYVGDDLGGLSNLSIVDSNRIQLVSSEKGDEYIEIFTKR